MDENLIGNILGSLINRDNDFCMGGGNGAWWIIILLLFFTGGFGGFGMNRAMAAPATQQDVADGFNFNQLDNGIRGLERGMCQLGYDNLAQTNGINMNVVHMETIFRLQSLRQAIRPSNAAARQIATLIA